MATLFQTHNARTRFCAILLRVLTRIRVFLIIWSRPARLKQTLCIGAEVNQEDEVPVSYKFHI